MGGGVGEAAKALCINELVRGGFEARYVGVKRKKIRKILTELKGVQQSYRWRWEDGEKVYRV